MLSLFIWFLDFRETYQRLEAIAIRCIPRIFTQKLFEAKSGDDKETSSPVLTLTSAPQCRDRKALTATPSPSSQQRAVRLEHLHSILQVRIRHKSGAVLLFFYDTC